MAGTHDDERYLAIDIGGTKLAAGVVDGWGAIVDQGRVATPESSDPDELFGALGELVRGVLGRTEGGVVACGVGCGGPMTRGGEAVSPLNIPAWRGFPLRGRLEELVGMEVHVDNDAKALALAEGWVGAAQGEVNYLAMVVSTGVGAGIVLDGRLLEGADGNAGHIGHVIVVPDGRACACGGQGCLEAEVSGLAIEAMTGGPAAAADEAMRTRCGRLVGLAVASVVNLLDLQLALVAGSVALGYGETFFAAAQAELDARAGLDFSRGARILPAGLGADGPLVGGAAVARRAVGR